MFRFIKNPDPRKKPPYGSRLDPHHPLSQGLVGCWLMNEGGGFPYELKSKTICTTKNGTFQFSSGGVLFTNGSLDTGLKSADLGDLSDGFTIVTRLSHSGSAIDGIVATSTSSTWGSDNGFSINFRTPGLMFRVNGYEAKENNTDLWPIGTTADLCTVWKPNYQEVFVDGSKFTVSDPAASPAYTADGNNILVGEYYDYERLLSGMIYFCYIYTRALSPDEIAWLHAEPYCMILQPQYWYMVDFGAAGGTDSLTASDITTGSPLLGTPTLGQTHALTATSITTGAPTLGTPTIGQAHALAGADIAAGTPLLGTPVLGQDHVLAAAGITTGAPLLGTPTAAEGTDNLTATDIVTGSPLLDSPALGQEHALAAADITSGAPLLGTPAVSEGAINLTASDIITGTPVLDAPTPGQIHALTGVDITAGLPVFADPVPGQVHVLAALGVLGGSPLTGSPALHMGGIVTPGERTYAISAEERTLVINAEDRTYTIQ